MEFSIYRVWLLCKKQWTENRQVYLLSILVTAGLVACILLYTSFTRFYGVDSGIQASILSVGLILVGGILTSSILSQFNDKVKGIAALTLPASALEKLVTAMLYSLIFFPLIFIAVVYPIIILIHAIDTGPMGHINALYHFEDFFKKWEGGLYVVTQAMVLMFSLFFKRYTVLKTALAVIILFFGVTGTNDIIAKSMIKVPAGPPFLNTEDALPQSKWDPSSYIKGNLHMKYYDLKGKVIADYKGEGPVAGMLLNDPPFDDLSISNDMISFRGITMDVGKHQEDTFTVETLLALGSEEKKIFNLLLFLTVPLMWLATWFRLKETQL